ncbi:tRNA pseudouridine synthase B [Alteribacillus iranensis]|uniref:tRNA pseudouridine synthase B n=2 Tax=Alteribacillus iranensis TaxID=930128 RepID=A0A1I2A2M7_9BACI|nr:tRNA pseudouridine(55) synthase TruB [Alteribacillus iranensis]SFE38181.1 tRNA pseudouridine synthase B [Alteribacillus iranensis]
MFEGIIPLYKPKGMTSHDCVMKMRKLLRTKKVGHTGTLDPDVEGVLPICVGRATKVVEYVTDMPKEYEAEVTLGVSTTTEDASGEVIAEKDIPPTLSKENIVVTLHKFKGKQSQVPPMYSAVKINGKKLYEYAREGIEIERPARDIEVYRITFIENSIQQVHHRMSFRFIVTCSKGTYIRTLCTDIGKELGYPAHMSDLTRTRSGPFMLERTLTFEEIENRKNEGLLEQVLVPITEGLIHLPHIEVNESMKGKILHGQVLSANNETPNEPFVFSYKGEALAVYQPHPLKDGLIKPKTMLKTI